MSRYWYRSPDVNMRIPLIMRSITVLHIPEDITAGSTEPWATPVIPADTAAQHQAIHPTVTAISAMIQATAIIHIQTA